jgi:peptidoglycan/LPS O-acetylase OafA/YrhL
MTRRHDLPGEVDTSWLWQGRVPGLDGLRAVSILFVVFAHLVMQQGSPVHEFFDGPPWDQPAFKFILYPGAWGVEMFFAISGFLITLLMLRERKRSGTISLRGFYTRRALRILPAYVVYLGAVAVFSRLETTTLTGKQWMASVSYTSNLYPTHWPLSHTWSLSLEEHFYLLWPILLLFLGPRRALFLALPFVVLSPLVRLGAWAALDGLVYRDFFCTFATPIRADAIAVGCCLAILCTSRYRPWLVRAGRVRFAGVIAPAGLLFASPFLLPQLLGEHSRHFENTADAILLAWVLLICLFGPQGPLRRVLTTRPMIGIGVLSYSLYLWHEFFIKDYPDRWIYRFPWNVLLMFAAAVLSYSVIETPFLRWKDRSQRPTHANKVELPPGEEVPLRNPDPTRPYAPDLPLPVALGEVGQTHGG